MKEFFNYISSRSSNLSTIVKECFTTHGLDLMENIFVAFLVVLVGFKIASCLATAFEKAMTKAKIEQTLRVFLRSLLLYAVRVLVLFSALTQLGIPAASLVAILGTVGAAIALGLKDSLSSFASGILILTLKPFVIGDFIEVSGKEGTVKEIGIMNTVLKTPDNKTIIVPNSQMSGAVITNYSTESTRRVDIDFCVSYSANMSKAIEVIEEIVSTHEKILSEPEPFVRITDYGSSAIVVTLKAWTETNDYWNVKFDLLEKVKIAFDENEIEMPYQQVDVKIKN